MHYVAARLTDAARGLRVRMPLYHDRNKPRVYVIACVGSYTAVVVQHTSGLLPASCPAHDHSRRTEDYNPQSASLPDTILCCQQIDPAYIVIYHSANLVTFHRTLVQA